jgi:hypothetical protein
VSTEGAVTIVPSPTDMRTAPPPAARGVATHGAPVAPGNDPSGLLTGPAPVSRLTVLPDGSLVTQYKDGGVTVLHSDGTISERLQLVEGYMYPEDSSDAKGWIRTLPDGTRC